MSNLPQLAPGPLMIDLSGCSLSELERERLLHPLIGGVILFKHNYRDAATTHRPV
jgi:beta-N-acetylhexosaminidase